MTADATGTGDKLNIFVLVHGTFARGAAWVSEDSRLCEALRTANEDISCRIVAFKWTGENSHGERLRAGKRLEKFLIKLTQIRPAANIILIGHSHGGNVILYAIRSWELQSRVEGVICMATPYIDCKSRDIALPGALCCFAVLLAGCAGIVVGVGAVGKWFEAGPNIESTFVSAGLVLYMFAFTFGVEAVADWFEAKQADIERRVGAPAVSTPILNLYFPGDEALIWLFLLAAASEVPFWLWMLGKYIALVSTAGMVVALIFLIPLSIFEITVHDWPAIEPVLRSFGAIPPLLGYTLVGLVIGQLALLLVPILIRAHVFGFGGEFLIDNWICRIGISRFPQRSHNVESRKISVPPVESEFPRGLSRIRHCCIYECEDALEEITKWLRHLLHNRRGF